ncbi:helix-turn-helix domain-containing protein [Natronomonas sp. CBA1123]|jgi:predicted DNA binding protein|uniref:helix-turn-helix domain-containing protein n=1 Tax=Natronomonas sp. CBA1123 TaxID=2668070 RepID=UPI0012E9AF19|nr:helix-turn-helix domain-containing protein [Natronomonas sp. CBA1123]MUV85368.1 helix-turn-helix domain-containing protein [Natronomonas sp. CBA1123]
MFQAEIHLQQHKECVVSKLATEFDENLDIAIEELHDELVTFVLEPGDNGPDVLATLRESEQVKHVENLGDGNILVTKTSCGAYSAIDRNHGILRRHTSIGPDRRVYTVLFFRRQDLRAMIEDFREIGTVTLGKLSAFDRTGVRLTDRQYEVIECALESGYFEWPREITSEELAEKMEISRATLLEHLRKAESKLLSDGLETATTEAVRTDHIEPTTPPK